MTINYTITATIITIIIIIIELIWQVWFILYCALITTKLI